MTPRTQPPARDILGPDTRLWPPRDAAMTAPKRIQPKRTKGWRMPENTVYVGRPSRWGNPYRVGAKFWDRLGEEPTITPEKAVELYRRNCDWRMTSEPNAPRIALELRGKNLACWCPLEDENGNHVPCHADVLLEWANS